LRRHGRGQGAALRVAVLDGVSGRPIAPFSLENSVPVVCASPATVQGAAWWRPAAGLAGASLSHVAAAAETNGLVRLQFSVAEGALFAAFLAHATPQTIRLTVPASQLGGSKHTKLAFDHGGQTYHLRHILILTGILDWLRFTYDFEIGSAEL
jgi:hypothetical protein